MRYNEDQEQWALFEIDGPDERGWVWLTGNGVTVNLGLREEVVAKLTQWLKMLKSADHDIQPQAQGGRMSEG